jgi:hypothetical protein
MGRAAFGDGAVLIAEERATGGTFIVVVWHRYLRQVQAIRPWLPDHNNTLPLFAPHGRLEVP